MNIELKNSLITIFVTATLTSSGWLAKDYFESENKKEKFAFELHKKLYDDGASTIKDVNKAYSDLYGLFGEGFGLTPIEFSEKHNAFRKELEKYSDYIDELERYGTTGQVRVAKNHMEWFWGIYSELDLQLKTAQQVESRAKELLLIENIESDHFKFVSDAFESDIERLVRNENRIFYVIGWYKKPVINRIEQYLNYQFREALEMQATADMASAINSLPELTKRSNNFEYKEKQLPFMFAEGRLFQAPTLEFKGDTLFFETKNEMLAQNIKMKFIASAIESDKHLQETLKKRKNVTKSENKKLTKGSKGRS